MKSAVLSSRTASCRLAIVLSAGAAAAARAPSSRRPTAPSPSGPTSAELPGQQRSGARHVVVFHGDALARAGDTEVITTGPIGKRSGENPPSCMRVVIGRDDGLSHRFDSPGAWPNTIDLTVQ